MGVAFSEPRLPTPDPRLVHILLNTVPNGVASMTLVNSLCAEISIYQGVGEQTGVLVERSAIRGKKGLCKSMRDLAIKSRVLGDGYYYIPIELWPKTKEPVVVHKHDWTVIGSIPRTSRAAKKRPKRAQAEQI
jgi:hypothetical protein